MSKLTFLHIEVDRRLNMDDSSDKMLDCFDVIDEEIIELCVKQ